MILPVTRNTVCELGSLPRNAGEIPTSQAALEDVKVADFASWLDDQLNELEFHFRAYSTQNSTLASIFDRRQRR